MPRISIDPGRHPVFTIVFTNLNGSDISVRDELSTLLPPSLPQSFSIRLHSSLGSIGFESFDPAYRSNNRVTKFRYGADSNYLSDWNIQNADNPPPVVSRRFNEPWILDVDDLEGEGGRFDRILNEGFRDLFLHSGVKKDNWPSCLRGEGYGRTSWRGFEKFIVNNGGYIYIYI